MNWPALVICAFATSLLSACASKESAPDQSSEPQQLTDARPITAPSLSFSPVDYRVVDVRFADEVPELAQQGQLDQILRERLPLMINHSGRAYAWKTAFGEAQADANTRLNVSWQQVKIDKEIQAPKTVFHGDGQSSHIEGKWIYSTQVALELHLLEGTALKSQTRLFAENKMERPIGRYCVLETYERQAMVREAFNQALDQFPALTRQWWPLSGKVARIRTQALEVSRLNTATDQAAFATWVLLDRGDLHKIKPQTRIRLYAREGDWLDPQCQYAQVSEQIGERTAWARVQSTQACDLAVGMSFHLVQPQTQPTEATDQASIEEAPDTQN